MSSGNQLLADSAPTRSLVAERKS